MEGMRSLVFYFYFIFIVLDLDWDWCVTGIGFGCGAGGWCAWLKADVTIGDDAMERSESNLTRLTCRSGVIQVIIPGTLASRKPPIPKMKNENENSSVIKINEYKKKGNLITMPTAQKPNNDVKIYFTTQQSLSCRIVNQINLPLISRRRFFLPHRV